MIERTYSIEIAEAIRNYLEDHDYNYVFNDEQGVIRFHMGSNGKVKALGYFVLVYQDGFSVRVRFPLGPSFLDDEDLTTMAKFFTRVNNGLRNGNFELDLEDGEIHYKIYCNCSDITPSVEMISDSIRCPMAMFHKYEEGIIGILFHGMSDEEAEKRCEDNNARVVAKLEELRARAARRRAAKAKEDGEPELVSGSTEHSGRDDSPLPPSLQDFLRKIAERASFEKKEDAAGEETPITPAPADDEEIDSL